MKSSAIKLGQPPRHYLTGEELPPVHWWAKAVRWVADWVGGL